MKKKGQEDLFKKFDKEHERFQKKMRVVDEIFFKHAEQHYRQEISMFVEKLLENTSVVISKEGKDEH